MDKRKLNRKRYFSEQIRRHVVEEFRTEPYCGLNLTLGVFSHFVPATAAHILIASISSATFHFSKYFTPIFYLYAWSPPDLQPGFLLWSAPREYTTSKSLEISRD
ncbi:MAG: hypothetical protein K9N46_14045 [Candidatus Marinimicrobia bacterium]|nr:hypothetical protein [Candidatus Neomarinimicrobiota bacterium]MCF7829996.1 hypothetical protein [Candidatus Neomarinimicrobiota bacterium]MCF7881850.1 hypothetical protein [Candidatus Neomarinimicrobiota bacterium]